MSNEANVDENVGKVYAKCIKIVTKVYVKCRKTNKPEFDSIPDIL